MAHGHAGLKRLLIAFALTLVAGFAARATTLEVDFISRANWCPGNGCVGATIQNQHQSWHQNFAGTREFVDYHREFLAQSDDFRLYGADVAGPDPDPAIFAAQAGPGSLLEWQHTSALNAFNRPALHQIDAPPLMHADPGGTQRNWQVRPATLTMGNATFCGYTIAAFGSAIDGMYHGNGHMTIATHDSPPGSGDMSSTNNATRDGAFFQWHKRIDDIYSDWAVSKYQLCDKSGIPIFYSVGSAAVGTAGSVLADRRGSNVYQGNTVVNPATQYGAIPRIASDIYVADNDNKNLLYASGVRQWNTLNAWDIDAFSILNPPGNAWYFSVTMASVGAPGTAVNGQAVRGGDVYESAGGGANALYRAETAIGLTAAATDELDALEVDAQRRIQGTNDTNSAGVYNRPKQFFSLRSGSTFGIQTTTGVAIDDSDILQFGPKGELQIAVSAATLGLVAADDLDAIAIVDFDASDTLTAPDRVYYSLTAGSPSGNPADVYCKTVAGANCGALGGNLEITAGGLGLLATDELDGLDIRPGTPTAGACCKSDGTCQELSASSCAAAGGVSSGLGTVCSACLCPSAPGACCKPDGTCTQLSDQACSVQGGVFRGPGVACAGANCPLTGNDECASAYQIPYDRPQYYEAPADNTYAYESPSDPPYSCYDHEVFFPPYGSGTIWYSYDVPGGPGTKRGILLDTSQTRYTYPYGGGAGDTRVAIYYSSSGTCATLQEVSCGDNYPGTYGETSYYGSASYDDPAPGRYYIQVSTVGAANRGTIKLVVLDPGANIPTLGTWGIIFLAILLVLTSIFLMSRRRKFSPAMMILSITGLVVAIGALSGCGAPPRAATTSAEIWPAESRIHRDPASPALVMFAHPKCACTKASLAALRRLIGEGGGKVDAHVLFAQAEGASVASLHTENWSLATSIEGVEVAPDPAAREADLFGATTSGQVMLYDATGRLRFSGGIAPMRGYPGDSPMLQSLRATIASLMDRGPAIAKVAMPNAVYGCALHGNGYAPGDEAARE